MRAASISPGAGRFRAPAEVCCRCCGRARSRRCLRPGRACAGPGGPGGLPEAGGGPRRSSRSRRRSPGRAAARGREAPVRPPPGPARLGGLAGPPRGSAGLTPVRARARARAAELPELQSPALASTRVFSGADPAAADIHAAPTSLQVVVALCARLMAHLMASNRIPCRVLRLLTLSLPDFLIAFLVFFPSPRLF